MDELPPSWQRARQARAQLEHAEALSLIEEFELLKGTDRPADIAVRMGYKPATLAQRFRRRGRTDLAKGLWGNTCGMQKSLPN